LFEASERPMGLATMEPERGASAILADPTIRSILDAPLQGSEMRKVQIERGALPTDPNEARSALQDEVNSSLTGIVSAAGDLSVSSMTGAVNFGLGSAQTLASGAVSEVLRHVPDAVSFALRAAARVVVEAIRKLWAAFGKDVQGKIEEQADGWLKKIWNNGALVTGLLTELYNLDALTNELTQAIANASRQSNFNDANRACSELEARYTKIKSVLDWILRGLGWLKGPLMGAIPWGPVAAYAIFVGIVGYAVYSAGDYIDAARFRSERLDHVVGVRTVVLSNLAQAVIDAARASS